MNRAAIEAVLADLNVSGWRLESAHGCDGTEEVCAQTCPVPMQVQVSPDEIAAALDAALAQEGDQGEAVAEAQRVLNYLRGYCNAGTALPPVGLIARLLRADRAAVPVAGDEVREAPPFFLTCRHCGHVGPRDEDHSCPCPYSDEECFQHRDRRAPQPPVETP